MRISDWSSDVCSSDLVWTDPGDLAGYDLVLPLFAWGYQRDVATWYALLDRLEREALPVVNPVPVLRWNSDKAYLAELGAKGVAVVPTVEVAALDDARLAEAMTALATGALRTEERRVGTEWSSTCGSWVSAYA